MGKMSYYLAIEFTPAFTANGRVDKRRLGTSLGTLKLPKNPRGIDFAAVKRALPQNHVIFRLNSCDGEDSIEFARLEDDLCRSRGPTKKPGRVQYKTK